VPNSRMEPAGLNVSAVATRGLGRRLMRTTLGSVQEPTWVSEVTRRVIIDLIATSGVNWVGRLAENDCFACLYDLTATPSTDHRMRNAAGDVHQHRINWRERYCQKAWIGRSDQAAFFRCSSSFRST
jgi:hypothetical protein